MVYEKREKLHNFQNVKLLYLFTEKNMPKSDIHPKWFKEHQSYLMVNAFV
jgi:hypothetical protein